MKSQTKVPLAILVLLTMFSSFTVFGQGQDYGPFAAPMSIIISNKTYSQEIATRLNTLSAFAENHASVVEKRVVSITKAMTSNDDDVNSYIDYANREVETSDSLTEQLNLLIVEYDSTADLFNLQLESISGIFGNYRDSLMTLPASTNEQVNQINQQLDIFYEQYDNVVAYVDQYRIENNLQRDLFNQSVKLSNLAIERFNASMDLLNLGITKIDPSLALKLHRLPEKE
ncbi:MAG: hypothetical protein H6765_02210 [Candidatus Peribacteria bacterium]|nr:MAG: hypothetical protein H6765_02210 [Candidatus Peribacteria bacterium]